MKIKWLCASIAVLLFSTAASGQNGWTDLFDGKTLKGWKILGGEATYAADKGEIVGTTVATKGNTFLVTEKTYRDFVLELEIKIEDTSGNSGVQVRSHYDAERGRVFGRQIELDPSSRKWTGGIYDEARRGWLYPVSYNAAAQHAYKAGAYNKFRIECIGEETKTWINGVPVAYLVDTIDRDGFIGLQVHDVKDADHAGKKIHFKNIRIKTDNLEATPFNKDVFIVNFLSNRLTSAETERGYKLLFNGKNNEGWKSAKGEGFPSSGWRINDGKLTVLSSEGKESANGGDIITNEMFSAFDLSFAFKLTAGANSGVKYFVTLKEKSEGSAIGLEYQVLDDSLHPDAKLGRDGNRTLASLYDLITAEKQKNFIKPIGEWNYGRVVVYPNNKVEHYLNGQKVLEYVRGSEEYRKLVSISKYKIWENFGEAKEGHILLQDHGNEVSFMNIRIKPLK